jgi:N-acetylmuramoyl-L-alanine amidase
MNNLLIGASSLLLLVTSSLSQWGETNPIATTTVGESVRIPVEVFTALESPKDCPQNLSGSVYVIDPGHGGTDPGTHTEKWGKMVAEAPYTLDISLRMKRYVECHGGTAVLTRTGSKIFDLPANQIIPFEREEDKFTSNGAPVVAERPGMIPRLLLGKEMVAQYPGKKIIWISVHIDQAVSSSNINGVHLLVPRSIENNDMTKSLLKKLDEGNRSRSYTKKNGRSVVAPLFIN